MVRPSGDHRRCRAPRTRPPKLGVHAIEVGPSGITACTRCWVRRLDRLQSWPAPQTALTHTAGGASTRTGTPPAVDWVTNFARPCRAERLFSAHGGAMLASEVARAGKPRGTRWPRTGHDLGALRSPKVLGERSSGRWWVRWNYRSSVDGEVVHWGNGELRTDLPKPWSGCAPPREPDGSPTPGREGLPLSTTTPPSRRAGKPGLSSAGQALARGREQQPLVGGGDAAQGPHSRPEPAASRGRRSRSAN